MAVTRGPLTLEGAGTELAPRPPTTVEGPDGPRARRVRASTGRVRRSVRRLVAWLRTPKGAAVSAIVLVGLVLRLYELNRVGLNSDEAVYAGQAGALVGDEGTSRFFSLFRAHPLLLQLLLGTIFRVVGVGDLTARAFVAVTFGGGSVLLTYLLVRELFGPRVQLTATALVAVLPYHVLVSRQVLVDTGMAFFVLLALWMFVVATKRRSREWFAGAFLAAGAATLTKEVAIITFAMFGALSFGVAGWRVLRSRRLLANAGLFVLLVAPFPLTRFIAQPGNASQFILWQFLRPPNHDPDYFLRILLQFGGYVFVGLAVLGIGRMLLRRVEGDLLVLTWFGAYYLFFQIWPTKLFPYLFVIVPALCICAGVGADLVAGWAGRGPWVARPGVRGFLALVGIGALCVHLATGSFALVSAGPREIEGMVDFDIEVQSFAGGREAGLWARKETPEGSRFLTIGPSMGNILRFYGLRDSVALSVSPDPRKRNPAYVPVANPDLALRRMGIHYIIWDAYSADRSSFYNARIRRYARKYGRRVALSVYVTDEGRLIARSGPAPEGVEVRVVVWEVRGADPEDPIPGAEHR